MRLFNAKMELPLKLYLGQEGYEAYSDMHHSETNQLIHGIFMPFVVYGVLYGIPAIFCRRSKTAHQMSIILYVLYVCYYFTFDGVGALATGISYFPSIMFYPKYQTFRFRLSLIKFCALLAAVSIGIQEFVGHWIFEGNSSDLTLLPTSLLIAPLFGVRCLLKYWLSLFMIPLLFLESLIFYPALLRLLMGG